MNFSWLDLIPGLGEASTPGQTSLDFGDINLNKGLAKVKSSSPFAAQVMQPPSTLNRALGKMAMGNRFLSKAAQMGKNVDPKVVGGRAVPLFLALDAAMELADESDPFQKNLAEGLGSAGGTLGGAAGGAQIGAILSGGTPAAAVTVPVGTILGALLMSDVGKQLAGGAYKAINPRGELEHAKRQIQKQAEIQKEIDSVNREIARDRARDQQRLAFETAILNAAMGR